MSFLSFLSYSLLLILGGWQLRGAIGATWRNVRNSHRFGDARHKWVEIDGKEHAFTDDQLEVAAERARRLASSKHRWVRRLAWLLAFAVLAYLVAGCGKRQIPTSAPRPALKAWVPVTGKSMLPTFPVTALVEAEFGVDYDTLQERQTVIFWDYTSGAPRFTHHRIVAKQGDNWIVQGDNPATNPIADRPWVTRDNFIARTTGRHTQILYAPPAP